MPWDGEGGHRKGWGSLTLKGSGFPLSSPEKRGGVKSVPPPHPYSPSRYSPAPTLPPLHSPTHSPNPPTTNEAPPPPPKPLPSPFLCFRDLDLRGELGFCKESRGVGGQPDSPRLALRWAKGRGALRAPPELPPKPLRPSHLIRFPLLCCRQKERSLLLLAKLSPKCHTPPSTARAMSVPPPPPAHRDGARGTPQHVPPPRPVPPFFSEP